MRGQTQVALKAILKYMRSFAASMIQSIGRFYPCAVEFHDGVIKPIEAPDHVDGQLIEYFHQQCFSAVKKSGVTGAAVCFDVWLDDDQAEDGLQMTLFSKDFPQIDLLMSWQHTENGIEYGKVRILSPDFRDDD